MRPSWKSSGSGPLSWSPEEAERYLASREPFGWRFGLERTRRLVSLLGMPQHRFASIHVVGTNGKSSVARMAVALLEAHGMRAGAYLSPHLERWTERVLVGDREIEPAALAAALERAAQAAETVDRTLEEGDAVTQFEVCTAAAFVALGAAGVEVAAIEAGLGGRLDATNVLPSRVTALTSVSLEHTEFLGGSEGEIAAEKLDVLRPHSTLVVGAVGEEVQALAQRVAEERAARVVKADAPGKWRLLLAMREQLVSRGFVADNFAVAAAAVEAVAGPLDEAALARVAGTLQVPGVLELRKGSPPLLLDAAHNPAGARALAQALPAIAAGQPVIACIAVLEGKDIDGIARELAPILAATVLTEVPPERLYGVGRPGARSVPASLLAESFRRAGAPEPVAVPDPVEAVSLARERARELGGMALLTGTHYLLPYADG